MTQRPLVCALPLIVLLAACNKEAPKETAESKSEKAAPKEEKKAPPKPAWVTEAGREVKCEFVEWKGAGKTRKAMFKMTPRSKKEISSVQTWEFYYDKSGKYLTNYPHATSIDDGPQSLGADGDSIAKGTDAVECEVTRVTYKDGTRWFNANLINDDDPRPKGGVTDAYLKDHAGEKVEIEVVDAKEGKLKLKNVSDKETKSIDIEIVYVLKDNKHETRDAWSTKLEIKPGKTVEHTIKLKTPPPEGFLSVDASAPYVLFADDTKFKNKNLNASERP
jgi:hypothetical protein